MPAPSAPHILMIFLDGVGLGRADAMNPLADRSLGSFARMAAHQAWTDHAVPVLEPAHVFKGIDAKLGVKGLPQSGTGQASLLTGENCALLAGRHYGPYPHSRTRGIIRERNVFRQVMALPGHGPESVAFANAYPRRFVELAEKRDRWTVTTRCCLDAGVEIRDTERLLAGDAVSADLTGAGWPEPGVLRKPITEGEAGRRLLRISRQHAFTLFEYYLTDKAGHARSTSMAEGVLASLNDVFAVLIEEMEPASDLVLVTSDHGNLEDLSTKGHTTNAVPLIAIGARAGGFGRARDLTDVIPCVLAALSET